MIVLVSMAAAAAAQPAARPPCGVRQARAQFELGQAHLKLNDYLQAMADFEAGYACLPMPIFLYDIAQMARLSGQRAKALDFYRAYLAAEPHARERVAVERWIATLSKSTRSRSEAASRPTPGAPVVIGPNATAAARTEPAPPPAITPPPAPAPAPASIAVSPEALTVDAKPAPEKPSHRGRWIALGVIGGVLVVGGAVAAGVLLGRPADGVPHGFHDLGSVDAAPH